MDAHIASYHLPSKSLVSGDLVVPDCTQMMFTYVEEDFVCDCYIHCRCRGLSVRICKCLRRQRKASQRCCSSR
jgi:hypothetical protein